MLREGWRELKTIGRAVGGRVGDPVQQRRRLRSRPLTEDTLDGFSGRGFLLSWAAECRHGATGPQSLSLRVGP